MAYVPPDTGAYPMQERAVSFPDVMTLEETAVYLNIKPRTLWAWTRLKNGPPRSYLGSQMRFSKRLVLEWLEGRTVVGPLGKLPTWDDETPGGKNEPPS